jgi:hypothetical protein
MAKQPIMNIPGTHYATVRIPGQTDATLSNNWVVWEAPSDCNITSISWTPDTAGPAVNGTNYATVKIIDGGQSGTETTVIASHAFSTGATGVALTKNTILSPAAAYAIEEGDMVVCQKTYAAGGAAMPAGTLTIGYVSK